MRTSLRNAIIVANALRELPTRPGRYTGENAQHLTEEVACTLFSRARRAQFSRGKPMSLAEIVAHSGRRRRSRITHPGKRGR